MAGLPSRTAGLQWRGLDQWLALWDKTGDLAARSGRVTLDRKQVVLAVFAALERNARP